MNRMCEREPGRFECASRCDDATMWLRDGASLSTHPLVPHFPTKVPYQTPQKDSWEVESRLWVPLEPDGVVVVWLPNGTDALQIGRGALPLRMVGMLGVVGVLGVLGCACAP